MRRSASWRHNIVTARAKRSSTLFVAKRQAISRSSPHKRIFSNTATTSVPSERLVCGKHSATVHDFPEKSCTVAECLQWVVGISKNVHGDYTVVRDVHGFSASYLKIILP